MAREKTDWLEIWIADVKSVIATMKANMVADLEAGYNPEGYCIRKQRVDIETREREFDRDMDRLKEMEPGKANWWCYVDLKKRGAIE